VTVSSTTFDPVQCNNDAKDVNAVLERATVTVAKTVSQPNVAVQYRGPLSYFIVVGNTGPSTARDVVLTDLWPRSLCQYRNGLNTTQGLCLTTGGDVSCHLGDIAVGQQVTVVIPFSVCASAVPGVIVNTASAFSPTAGDCKDSSVSLDIRSASRRSRRSETSTTAVITPAPEARMIIKHAAVPTATPLPEIDSRLAPVVVQLKASVSGQSVTISLTNTNVLAIRVGSIGVTADSSIFNLDVTKTSEHVVATTCASFVGRKLPAMWSEECTVTFASSVKLNHFAVAVAGVAKTSKGVASVQGVANA
jgi:uncharacterized repeat protein (TIGR01451 family)